MTEPSHPASSLHHIAVAGALAFCGACGGEPSATVPPSEPAAVPAAPATPTPTAPAPVAPAPVAPAPAAPVPAPVPGPVVDLLHAVATEVAVSSVYRDDATQIGRLFDGDSGTAWNSRTGELVGAWIEIEVPEGASVTAIEMTAGYTREGGTTDLFTGNHRIARVRVSLDGAPLGEHALDTASRALQSLPVEGGAGVYRIEVLEVLPGSRDDWQETCVSELRVLGAAGAAPAGSAPTTSLQPLGAGEVAGGALGEIAGEAVGGAGADAMSTIRWLALEWPAYEDHLYMSDPFETPAPTPSSRPVATRAELVGRVIAIVEPVAPERAAALRALVAPDSLRWSARAGDLAVVVAALDEAFADLESLEACYWAGTRSELFMARAELLAEEIAARLDALAEDAEEGTPNEAGVRPTPADARRLRADADAASEFVTWLAQIEGAATDDGEDDLRRFREHRPPTALGIDREWDALLAAAERTARDCDGLYDDGNDDED